MLLLGRQDAGGLKLRPDGIDVRLLEGFAIGFAAVDGCSAAGLVKVHVRDTRESEVGASKASRELANSSAYQFPVTPLYSPKSTHRTMQLDHQ
jgi:hypothetical protein